MLVELTAPKTTRALAIWLRNIAEQIEAYTDTKIWIDEAAMQAIISMLIKIESDRE